MPAEVPITIAPGLELTEKVPGISSVRVIDSERRLDLSWDRYVRLKAAAQAVTALDANVLDAGGFDGALAFFLPQAQVDVIDPATTGGNVLSIPAPDKSYRTVVAVDVLEHIDPALRASVLLELARVSAQHLILNYPCHESLEAQKIALSLTGNEFIREHVEWELPDSQWVLKELRALGFEGQLTRHTSVAVWLGQYVILNTVPGAAAFNRYLIENHGDEPFDACLYHLLVCQRDF